MPKVQARKGKYAWVLVVHVFVCSYDYSFFFGRRAIAKIFSLHLSELLSGCPSNTTSRPAERS